MGHQPLWYTPTGPFVPSTRAAPLPDRPPDDHLIFHDDFSTFDFSTWKHELTMGVDMEFKQVNSRDNSYVRDGVLFLKPTLTEDKLDENAWRDSTQLVGQHRRSLGNRTCEPVHG